jgi:hypothetical protein
LDPALAFNASQRRFVQSLIDVVSNHAGRTITLEGTRHNGPWSGEPRYAIEVELTDILWGPSEFVRLSGGFA